MKRRSIDNALRSAKRLVHRIPGITGVDHGMLYTDMTPTGRHGIRFHVATKHPLSRIASENVLPTAIDGHPCDVLQARYAPHASPRDAVTPLVPGVSVGNIPRDATGTIGAFVQHTPTGRRCILSNWHVLAGSTDAAVGDGISQPGPEHLGNQPARIVAHLLMWANLDHGYDAAIAQLEDAVSVSGTPFDTPTAIAGLADPAIGMQVLKSGVATGVTHAIIDGIDGSYQMDYTAYGDTVRWMDGIHLVIDPANPAEEISMDGDSGALWLTSDGHAVALNFGGEDGLGPTADYAVAHALSRILHLLDLTL